MGACIFRTSRRYAAAEVYLPAFPTQLTHPTPPRPSPYLACILRSHSCHALVCFQVLSAALIKIGSRAVELETTWVLSASLALPSSAKQ